MARRFSGVRLRAIRTDRGMRREELALAVDRSFAAIASYERGRSVPRVGVVTALADVLGCGVDELFTDDAAEG